MKTVLNRKSLRKATAILSALVILILAVPVSGAESASFGGTHWVATGFNIIYLELLDDSTREWIEKFGSLIQFVPEKSMLSFPTLCSICCTLDFNRDGTCRLFLGLSAFGQVDDTTCGTSYGAWRSAGNMLTLTIDGDTVPVTCSNGVLSISAMGFGLDFSEL